MVSSEKEPMFGILALQGAFDAHQQALARLGIASQLLRYPRDFSNLAGLIIPGGESTSMLRLGNEELWEGIIEAAKAGLPILGTCAGLILLASEVLHPTQRSLGILNVTVCRNAYGRQINSFIDTSMNWTNNAKPLINKAYPENTASLVLANPVEGVFIRAPRIVTIGDNVSVLLKRNDNEEAVFVQQKNVFATTFHPELATQPSMVYQLFVKFALLV